MPRMRPFMPPGTVAQELLAAARDPGFVPQAAAVSVEASPEVSAMPAPELPEVPPEMLAEARQIADILNRIDDLHAEIDAIIDARTDAVKLLCEGLPWACIRLDITRHEHCRCAILRRFGEETCAALSGRAN